MMNAQMTEVVCVLASTENDSILQATVVQVSAMQSSAWLAVMVLTVGVEGIEAHFR